MDENEVVGQRAEDFGLNEKQKRFCEYYVKNQSAGKSYFQAYSIDENKKIGMNSAYSNGSKLLKSDKIKNYLNVLRRETKKKAMLSVEDIVNELETIISDVGGVKMSDKLKAIELLGKYHGAWLDKMEVNSNSNIEINLTGIENNPMKVIESDPVVLIEDKENGNN